MERTGGESHIHMELTAGAVPPPALRGSTPTLQAHPVSSLKAAPSTATSTYARSALFSALVMSAGAAIPTCLRRPPGGSAGTLAGISPFQCLRRSPRPRGAEQHQGLRHPSRWRALLSRGDGRNVVRVQRSVCVAFPERNPPVRDGRSRKTGGTFLAYGRQGRG